MYHKYFVNVFQRIGLTNSQHSSLYFWGMHLSICQHMHRFIYIPCGNVISLEAFMQANVYQNVVYRSISTACLQSYIFLSNQPKSLMRKPVVFLNIKKPSGQLNKIPIWLFSWLPGFEVSWNWSIQNKERKKNSNCCF